MKRHNRKSRRAVEVESYVTTRDEWPDTIDTFVSSAYVARGFRVVNGHMEWQYFKDEDSAKKWADGIHEQVGSPLPLLTQEEIQRAIRLLVDRIECCGASSKLTDAVVFAGDLAQAVGNESPANGFAAHRILVELKRFA